MIYAPLSSYTVTKDEPLQANTTISASGQALVGALVNGVYGVKPSAGAAGEKFAGFVLAQTSAAPFSQATAVKVEETTLGVSGAFTLAQLPVGGTLVVHNITTGATITLGALVGQTWTHAGSAGADVRFTYTYALTVTQARSMFGDTQPGGYAGYMVKQIGAAKQGVIYTDQIDTAVNWALATGVKLAAGGKVTDQAGAGVAIDANIIAVPSVDFPFLGLQFAAVGS